MAVFSLFGNSRVWLSVLVVSGSILQLYGFLLHPSSTSHPFVVVERSPQVLTDRVSLSLQPGIIKAKRPTTTTTTRLYNKLWDRLQVEEDEEPFWYLVNCVAGLEMDLLRQCRQVCQDLPDAYKFVVPTEIKTRSHGANRMVTETKVKYQGYVFAKLRLCPDVYAAVQELDLCRSWMGTVNHKGHKKLPPAPLALNEVEVEDFGLEDLEFVEEEAEIVLEGEKVVILDDEAVEDKKKQQEAEAIKVFLGIKVGDMVKVSKRCKFYDEDGIVRRLKDGKIFLRFYTYGSMFEEWMDPGDVRKLTDAEVLKGLSGPSEPVTQRDFEEKSDDYDGNGRKTAGNFQRDLMGNARGGGGDLRNRRQDRVERGQNTRDFSANDRKREEKNWDWYKESRRENKGVVADDDYSYRPGSNSGDDALGDADAQWNRPPSQRQQRREKNGNQPQNRNNKEDWSKFVSPASAPKKSGEDDFFSSLMTDLNKDLNTGDSRGPSPAPRSSEPSSSSSPAKEEDDFFASLMAEIETEDESKQSGSGSSSASPDSSLYVDDFFATLDKSSNDKGKKDGEGKDSTFNEDDLFDSFDVVDSKAEDRFDLDKTKPKGTNAPAREDDEDDFFASLQAELGTALDSDETGSSGGSIEDDDFFSSLEKEVSSKLDNDLEAKKSPPKRKAKPTESASQTPPSTNPGGGDFGKLTVPKLKELLRARGLKVSGKKAELIERLGD